MVLALLGCGGSGRGLGSPPLLSLLPDLVLLLWLVIISSWQLPLLERPLMPCKAGTLWLLYCKYLGPGLEGCRERPRQDGRAVEGTRSVHGGLALRLLPLLEGLCTALCICEEVLILSILRGAPVINTRL